MPELITTGWVVEENGDCLGHISLVFYNEFGEEINSFIAEKHQEDADNWVESFIDLDSAYQWLSGGVE